VGISEGTATEEEEGNREAGGRANSAVDLQLPEPPGQDEAGRPGLVADPKFGAGMGLPELGEDLLQGVILQWRLDPVHPAQSATSPLLQANHFPFQNTLRSKGEQP